jgi:hypothetical protein
MKTLMTGVVNRIHTFLARTLFSATEDKAFQEALDRAAAPWTKAWDEPEYLADFLMPHSENAELSKSIVQGRIMLPGLKKHTGCSSQERA